jgi:hypothetical protein
MQVTTTKYVQARKCPGPKNAHVNGMGEVNGGEMNGGEGGCRCQICSHEWEGPGECWRGMVWRGHSQSTDSSGDPTAGRAHYRKPGHADHKLWA